MYRLFLSLRYLLTRPINLLGMAGITIGVWALIVVVSVFSGVIQVVEEHLRDATGDAVVTTLPSWTSWPRVQKALQNDPNVVATAPRIVHYGMLLRPGHRPPPAPLPGRGALHGGDQPFLFVLGVDAAAESRVTGFGRWVVAPEIPADTRVADAAAPLAAVGGKPAVLVGLDRMRREGLRRGDAVVLTTAKMRTDAAGRTTTEKIQLELVIAGAFKSRHSGFDGNTVFVGAETLRGALFPDHPEAVQEVVVHVADAGAATLAATVDRLDRAVARATERDGHGWGEVWTWRERNRVLLESIEHQRAIMQVVLVVIMIVAAFLMLATLSMMVTEKISDIGILTAMGGTPGGVTVVFLACGVAVTIAGVVLGAVTGIATALHLEEVRQVVRWATGIDLFPIEAYNLDRVPSAIDPWWLLLVAAMALVVGFVVSVVPALRAARHDPLVSLRGI